MREYYYYLNISFFGRIWILGDKNQIWMRIWRWKLWLVTVSKFIHYWKVSQMSQVKVVAITFHRFCFVFIWLRYISYIYYPVARVNTDWQLYVSKTMTFEWVGNIFYLAAQNHICGLSIDSYYCQPNITVFIKRSEEI